MSAWKNCGWVVMQPIGTIIKFYPFLNPDERQIVGSIIDTSENYRDFVNKLADYVIKFKPPENILYLAVFQTLEIDEQAIKDKICSIDAPFVESLNAIFQKSLDCSGKTDSSQLHLLVQDLLKSDIGDWVRLNVLYNIIYFFDDPVERFEYVDLMKEILNRSPSLHNFEPIYNLNEAYRHRREGNVDKALELCDIALYQAKEIDDLMAIGAALDMKASIIKDNDIVKASELIEEYYSLYNQLDYRIGISMAAADMGNAYFILGMYDFALKFYLEAAQLLPGDIDTAGDYEYVFARIYNVLGQFDDAMNWIKREKDDDESELLLQKRPLFHLAVAETQIHRGYREKARQHLDTAREIVFKSGDEIPLALYNYEEGFFELTFGNVINSLQLFENALEIAERLNFQLIINQCLLAMTNAEVISKSSSNPDTSGKWMATLEKHAKEKHYVGIRMQCAILKAEHQIMIGELDLASYTLKNALSISESPGVETHRKRIQSDLEKINLIQES
ncbi:MAG: tetratricopeptide repeat protein [Candidatus Thorarchaeota archaeon]